jgi:hypothetical protein
MHIRTSGSEVFSRLFPSLDAEKLRLLLRKEHNVSDKVQTVLIHPSPVTLFALDVAFQAEQPVWSQQTIRLYRFLDRMRDLSKIYIYLDFLTHVKQGPRWNSSIAAFLKLEEEELLNVADSDREAAREQTIKRAVYALTKEIDGTGFMNRVDRLCDIVDKATRYYLAIGLAPFIKDEHHTPPMPLSSREHEGDSIETKARKFIHVMEEGFKGMRLMELDEVVGDLLITSQKGKRSVSFMQRGRKGEEIIGHDFSRPGFRVSHVSNYLNTDVPIIASMIGREIHATKSTHLTRNFFIDRISKTCLILGTHLNKEAEVALVGETSSNVSKEPKEVKSIMDNIAKSDKELAEFKERRDVLEKAKNNTDMVCQLDRIHRTVAKEIAKTRTANRKILTFNGEDDDNENDNGVEQIFGMPPVGVPYGEIDTGPSSVADALRKKNTKTLTENQRKETMRLLTKSLADHKKLLTICKQEIEQLLNENNEKDLRLTNFKNGIQALEKIIQEKENVLKTSNLMNKELTDQLTRMDKVVEQLGVALKLSKMDTEKVMVAAKNCRVGGQWAVSDSMDPKERIERARETIMNIFGGHYTDEDLDAAIRKQVTTKRNDRTSYHVMLTEQCVRILPIFAEVGNESELQKSNSWLGPNVWYADRRYVDKISLEEDQASITGSILGMVNETPVEENEEHILPPVGFSPTETVSFVDVSPISRSRANEMRCALNAVGRPIIGDMYSRRFLGIQPALKSDAGVAIEIPLEQAWDKILTTALQLSEPHVNDNGQHVKAHLTHASLRRYVVPIVALYCGASLASDNIVAYTILADAYHYKQIGGLVPKTDTAMNYMLEKFIEKKLQAGAHDRIVKSFSTVKKDVRRHLSKIKHQ